MKRMLDWIERVGNRMPSPAVLFVILCLGTILISQVLAWTGWQATSQVAVPKEVAATETYQSGSSEPTIAPTESYASDDHYELKTETTKIQGLLSVDGVRFLFTSFVSNFRNFAAVAILLVVMIGVALAETSGLIGALIRKLVAISSERSLTPIIVFIGMLSSIASDAGYLVLIPLGAAAFRSVGRNPLAGIAAAFAGVSAGFGVNFMITPMDSVLTEITNETLGTGAKHISLVSNLYFAIGSTIFITIVLTLVSSLIVERQLGKYDPALADDGDGPADPIDEELTLTPEAESKGLRYAGIATLIVVIALTLLTVIPGAPLRNPETGEVIGDSPFMDSLIVMISMIFLAAGWAFGRGAGTIKDHNEVVDSIVKSWSGMAGLIFLFLLIAQFIAYFNYSHIPDVAAIKLGDLLDHMSLGAVWLLIIVIIFTALVNFIMPAAIAKWALLAPILVPLFLRLGIAPQTVLAAYRTGDGPTNVLTPLMAYFPLIVVFAKKYNKQSGIGTVISMMLPYAVVLSVAWTLFFVAWYLIGIPLGPGWSVHL